MSEKQQTEPIEIDELHRIDPKDGELSFRELFKKSIWAIVVLMAVTFTSLFLFKKLGWADAEVLHDFIDAFGAWEVAGYIFVMELTMFPVSVDMVWPFVLTWSVPKAVIVMGTASVVGSFCAYLVGRLLGHIPIINNYVRRNTKPETAAMMKRYGAWGVAIGGIAPLPFSTICTLAGMAKLPILRVLLALQIRYVRMGLYFLIFSGFLSLG